MLVEINEFFVRLLGPFWTMNNPITFLSIASVIALGIFYGLFIVSIFIVVCAMFGLIILVLETFARKLYVRWWQRALVRTIFLPSGFDTKAEKKQQQRPADTVHPLIVILFDKVKVAFELTEGGGVCARIPRVGISKSDVVDYCNTALFFLDIRKYITVDVNRDRYRHNFYSTFHLTWNTDDVCIQVYPRNVLFKTRRSLERIFGRKGEFKNPYLS